MNKLNGPAYRYMNRLPTWLLRLMEILVVLTLDEADCDSKAWSLVEDDVAAQARHQSTKSEFSSSRIGDTFRHICNKGIIRRGLEPENVLWISNGYLKLTVFTSAKTGEPDTRTHSSSEFPEHIAAEALLNDGQAVPVDGWTSGIRTFEKIVGLHPFCDEDPMGISRRFWRAKFISVVR